MKPFPHNYEVCVKAGTETPVQITSSRLALLRSAPPLQFGGPGDLWSPETLLTAAGTDCFVLTFRAIASASRLAWTSLECGGKGTLDSQDGVVRFNAFHLNATLMLPPDSDPGRAQKVVEKAEKNCLVANSLKCPVSLELQVMVEETVSNPL